MGFYEHKITEFSQKVADLPDQPTLSPQELKQRFDSSPEELRRAHNAICDEGERLSARVEGIVVDTFGDTIDREMLSHELAAELDGKAEQTALAAETAARENLAETVAQKCECYFGTYTGDGEANRVIELGFQPVAAIILCEESFFALKTQTYTCVQNTDVTTTANAMAENGLHVGTTEKDSRYPSSNTNEKGRTYEYIAFKA